MKFEEHRSEHHHTPLNFKSLILSNVVLSDYPEAEVYQAELATGETIHYILTRDEEGSVEGFEFEIHEYKHLENLPEVPGYWGNAAVSVSVLNQPDFDKWYKIQNKRILDPVKINLFLNEVGKLS